MNSHFAAQAANQLEWDNYIAMGEETMELMFPPTNELPNPFDVDSSSEEEEDEANDRLARKRRQPDRAPSHLWETAMPTRVLPNGDRVRRLPSEMPWYEEYILHPRPGVKQWEKMFRNRFRMSYASFLKHCEEVKNHPLFFQWSDAVDCTGKHSTPIELLLLGILRYLGRGWTIDDVEEQTSISKTTLFRFLGVYLRFGSTHLYHKHVNLPKTQEQLDDAGNEFAAAGFHGAFGSMDATHIGMGKCENKLRNHHSSFKETKPARTYNATCNHRRRILSTTLGHPGRWNDKTLVLFDPLARMLSYDDQDGGLFGNNQFELYELGDDGVTVFKRSYRGSWILCDNGYLRRASMIPPSKTYSTIAEKNFSKWLESMRKDIECTFGILKGRWRILKCGTEIHGHKRTDQVWLTCCALHNFLLVEDGLDNNWEIDYYLGPEGEHDAQDINTYAFNPEAEAATTNQTEDAHLAGILQNVNTTGRTITLHADLANATLINNNEPVKVNRLASSVFKKRLIAHWDILYERSMITWTRTGRRRNNSSTNN